MKKAQGLSIQTIIIAVMALVVLVVMVLIFIGVINPASIFFGQQLSCEARGGTCPLTKEQCETTEGGLFTANFQCVQPGTKEPVKYAGEEGCCIVKK